MMVSKYFIERERGDNIVGRKKVKMGVQWIISDKTYDYVVLFGWFT